MTPCATSWISASKDSCLNTTREYSGYEAYHSDMATPWHHCDMVIGKHDKAHLKRSLRFGTFVL